MQQNKLRFKPVTHLVFDVDGLLLDNTPTIRQILLKSFIQYNAVVSRNLMIQILGHTKMESLAILREETKLYNVTLKQLLQEYNFWSRSELPKCNLKPGVTFIIKHFSSKDIPMAIASSSNKEDYIYKTIKHRNLFDLFHHTVLCELNYGITLPGRPETSLHVACAADFNVPPSQVLAFECSPNGVDAALACGMQVVMVPDSIIRDPELTRKATICIRSLDHFIPEEFGLPSFHICSIP